MVSLNTQDAIKLGLFSLDQIAINYQSKSGEEKQEIIETNRITYITLRGKKITKIDLTPVERLESSLVSLSLDDNSLEKIDLSPFERCCCLYSLSLANNNLERLDLDPLSNCTSLSSLRLDNNSLQQIDLTPLENCTRIYTISLTGNLIRELDLTPLSGSKNLRTLYLGSNNVEKLLLPMSNGLEYVSIENNCLSRLDLSALTNSHNMSELRLEQNVITDIDLSPLSNRTSLLVLNLSNNRLQKIATPENCPNLKWLFLQKNGLEKVDLSNLIGNAILEQLHLSENRLEDVDLSPLSECTSIERIYLFNNRLKTIDLNPLVGCINLKDLNLAGNKLKRIDLTPLAKCMHLERIDLSGEEFEELDLTPLANCRKLYRIGLWGLEKGDALSLLSEPTMKAQLSMRSQLWMRNYDVPVPLKSLDLVKTLIPIVQQHEPNSWKHLHLAHCFAKVIDCNELGFLDVSLSDVVSILEEPDISIIQQNLIAAYRKQVERGGTTIGCDIEAISSGHPLDDLVPRIIGLRKDEMKPITISIDTSKHIMDLRPLWLTAHGYEILSRNEFGTHCSTDKLTGIVDALNELGVSVEAVENQKPTYAPTEMSDNMRDYVWAMVTPLKTPFEELHGIGPKTKGLLKKAGYTSVWAIAESNEQALAATISGISRKGAIKVISSAKEMTQQLIQFRSKVFD